MLVSYYDLYYVYVHECAFMCVNVWLCAWRCENHES